MDRTGGLLTNKERVLKRSTGYDPDKIVQEGRFLTDLFSELDDASTDPAAEEEESPGKYAKDTRDKGKKQPYVHSPDLIIILDYPNNLWAVREANYAGVPVIAICDTDCDPSWIQYPIPANDDSITGVKLIAGVLSMSSKEGHDRRMHLLSLRAETE